MRTVTFARSDTDNGVYESDPSDKVFADLMINEAGYLVGGAGDRWLISGDFANHSL